jgi:hypothetical protein
MRSCRRKPCFPEDVIFVGINRVLLTASFEKKKDKVKLVNVNVAD